MDSSLIAVRWLGTGFGVLGATRLPSSLLVLTTGRHSISAVIFPSFYFPVSVATVKLTRYALKLFNLLAAVLFQRAKRRRNGY